jgi:hypothetical protein
VGGLRNPAISSPIHAGGKCLDVAGASAASGTNVQQWSWLGGENQQWRIQDTGDGLLRLQPRHAPLQTLATQGASTLDGANVRTWTWDGGNAQRWEIQPE